MKTKKFLLFILTLSFIGTAYSQEIIFKGLVKNADSKLIQNVIVSAKYKNKQAEISIASSGIFSTVLSDTVNLESISFSYLGYEPFLITTKQILLFIRTKKNADFLIVLKTKNINLNQVIVTDKHPFYHNENASVFDYEITPNGNLILVMEKNIYLINQQDSILKTIHNTSGITGIIKSCSGKMFLVSKKQLYPTYINDTSFLISNNPLEINSSLKQIGEVIACDSLIKIKEHISLHNQKIVYQLQPISDPSVEVDFYVAQNKVQLKNAIKEKAAIDRYDSFAREEKTPDVMTTETSFGGMVGNGSNGRLGKAYFYDEMMQVVWSEDQKVWNYEFYTSKKIYAPVFLHNDSIYVFDHVVNKVQVFSYKQTGNNINFNAILKDSISYQKKKGWEKIILQDRYTGEFFTAYKNERLVLNKISLFENKRQVNLTFPKNHLFVEKIKMYNHTAYYLWRDQLDPTSMWTLYKVAAE